MACEITTIAYTGSKVESLETGLRALCGLPALKPQGLKVFSTKTKSFRSLEIQRRTSESREQNILASPQSSLHSQSHRAP